VGFSQDAVKTPEACCAAAAKVFDPKFQADCACLPDVIQHTKHFDKELFDYCESRRQLPAELWAWWGGAADGCADSPFLLADGLSGGPRDLQPRLVGAAISAAPRFLPRQSCTLHSAVAAWLHLHPPASFMRFLAQAR
jgi:hypothetical protein